MLRLSFLAAAVMATACATTPENQITAKWQPAIDPDTVQVMVLGSYHMAPSNRDLANADVESVLTPRRQAELAAVVDSLAAFQPTVVATERITEAPDYVDPKFADFTQETLLENPNERVQIAYRLAARAGVTRVYGVDEQPSDGEPDYFPFDKLMAHTAETGQGDELGAYVAAIQAMVAEYAKKQADHTIAELLLETNHGSMASAETYYQMFQFDRGEAQPGSELQAYWFMRNAKIISKLIQVTEPGDRVVVVYGAGHKFWFEHFLDNTPGLVRIDPAPYLQRAVGEYSTHCFVRCWRPNKRRQRKSARFPVHRRDASGCMGLS